jgi:serine/threonine-protein kinase RsbW
MNNTLVKVFHEDGEVVRLLPVGSAQDISLIPGILSAFEEQFRNRYRTFAMDLGRMEELSPSLIVLLLELTARTRRHGGDLHLVNVGQRSQEDLKNFDLFGYLHLLENQPEPAVQHLPDPLVTNESPTTGPQVESLAIPSRPDVVYKACDFVVLISRRMGFSENEVNKIKLAVYEACLNVVEHAYHSDPTKSVRVTVFQTPQKLEVQVIDQGDGFEASNDNFDVMAAAAARQTGGMGLHIIRRSMDEVAYQRNTHEGNKLIMIKYI